MTKNWNWEPGARVIQDFQAPDPHQAPYLGEPVPSLDGELVARVVSMDQGEFTIAVNGQQWDTSYDNIWNLHFTPEGRAVGLVSSMGTWTLAIDGQIWPQEYEYIWQPRVGLSGEHIAAAVKVDGQYGMAVDGQNWEHLFPNATGFTATPEADRTAAVVQTQPLDQGDVETFKKGIFSVAVDGRVWEETFLNVWDPCLRDSGESVAATVRLSPSDYTIAVDGQCWPGRYAMAWQPVFNPRDGSVIAPVKVGPQWGLARDDQLIWEPGFTQLWHQQVSADGEVVAAIVASHYGEFTVAVNGEPWKHTYAVVSDLVLSPDGQRAAAVGQAGLKISLDEKQLTSQRWQVIVNGHPWTGWYDRVFTPVISPDGRHTAVRVEKNGACTVLVDDKAYYRPFSKVWDPVFSPDSSKVLIRAMDGSKMVRIVASVKDFRA